MLMRLLVIAPLILAAVNITFAEKRNMLVEKKAITEDSPTNIAKNRKRNLLPNLALKDVGGHAE